MHSGNSPPYVGAHWPQSATALYLLGHVLHVAPVQPLRHVHVQPLSSVPVTDAALPLQSSETSHERVQLG